MYNNGDICLGNGIHFPPLDMACKLQTGRTSDSDNIHSVSEELSCFHPITERST